MSKTQLPTTLTTTAIALVLAVSTAAGPAFAQTAEEKGLEIAKAIDARDLGWGATSAVLRSYRTPTSRTPMTSGCICQR